MADNNAWSQLDDDLEGILEATSSGPVHRKIDATTTIVYNLAKERFGTVERRGQRQPQQQPNRREKEIRRLRGEIKGLNKLFKTSSTPEKEGIKDLTSKLREQLCKLRRAENLRKQRRKKEKWRAQFVKDPYSFTKALLGQQKSGTLSSSKLETEEFLAEAHSDPTRSRGLDANRNILRPAKPTIALNAKEPTWQEVQDVVHKAKSASAPGPSGIPYKVYKKCPKLLKRL